MTQPFDAAAASAAYRNALEVIGAVEPTVADAIRAELADQRASLKLIASENYASPAVLLTMGNWLSDKYAEGTIGHRFYAGCQNVDTVEQTRRRPRQGAVRRAARLRAAALRHRRQPGRVLGDPRPAGRGAGAGRARREARQRPDRRRTGSSCASALGNQRMLGMSLDAGGHLTHGFRPNISGKMFHQRSYGTDPDDRAARLRRGRARRRASSSR